MEEEKKQLTHNAHNFYQFKAIHFKLQFTSIIFFFFQKKGFSCVVVVVDSLHFWAFIRNYSNALYLSMFVLANQHPIYDQHIGFNNCYLNAVTPSLSEKYFITCDTCDVCAPTIVIVDVFEFAELSDYL